MSNITRILIFFSLGMGLIVSPAFADSIQSKIDEAQDGSVVRLKSGEYEEEVILNKPIVLKGEGDVIIRSCEPGPVISIKGKGSTLENINVEHCGEEDKDAAIQVSGSHHLLKKLNITTERLGIKLYDVSDSEIIDSRITGRFKGNGVDLWKSHDNTLRNIKVEKALDAIYLERSPKNFIENNDVQYSRYGIHLMFSDDNIVERNDSRQNTTGMMVMESKRTLVTDNRFHTNQGNVNAQGLLVFRAPGTYVRNNEFIANRIGIYTEDAGKTKIIGNKLLDNSIGIQFKKSDGNKVWRNTFVGNVNDAQAIDSIGNRLDGNYWDAADKVDADGDGISDIPFAADPYFQALTSEIPAYKLFFNSPGLTLLKKMLKSPDETLLADSQPLMAMTNKVEKKETGITALWIAGIMMMLVSILIFISGRKKI